MYDGQGTLESPVTGWIRVDDGRLVTIPHVNWIKCKKHPAKGDGVAILDCKHMFRLRDAVAKTLLCTRIPSNGHAGLHQQDNSISLYIQTIRSAFIVAASRWQGHITVQETKVDDSLALKTWLFLSVSPYLERIPCAHRVDSRYCLMERLSGLQLAFPWSCQTAPWHLRLLQSGSGRCFQLDIGNAIQFPR